MYTEAFHEANAVLDLIPPASSSTAVNGTWVSMADYERVAALILVGAIAATGTFDAKFEQATDSSGTGAKDITGKAITQLTDADDDKTLCIEVLAEDLDVNNGFDYVRLTLTPATAATIAGAVVLGTSARSKPVDQTGYEEVVA